MRNKLRICLSTLAVSIAVALNMVGCTKVESPTLYNPGLGNGPQPVVDSLSPEGSALAGIDTLTIYGKNFLTNLDSDQVSFLNYTTKAFSYYGYGYSPIISASPTKIVLKAPAISGDTIQVRVSVIGAANFSPVYSYKLIAAITPFSNLPTATGDNAYGICTGPDSNLYVSISNATLGTKDKGIFRITSDGTVAASPYALSTTGNVDWPFIKFGPGNFIYASKGVRAIYRLSQGTSSTAWAPVPSGAFSDFDFDPNHNLWAGWSVTVNGVPSYGIYRIKTDASTKLFPFTGSVGSVRYYNGYLYFVSNPGSGPNKVYRAPLVNDSLGTPEVYFDLAEDPAGGNNIYAITFSADGDLFVATEATDYLLVVHPGGAIDKPYSLYVSGKVLNSPCKSFAWIGQNLFASTATFGILKIVARKQGAPYYGIQ
ncbi:MAG TPA: IPT/TIG domain-containing protein [Candidatus Acidoferrales bacterium]|nr:IPT/TIG domain-containing protein [Candidatus Acidoferrales bacterium]